MIHYINNNVYEKIDTMLALFDTRRILWKPVDYPQFQKAESFIVGI